MIKPTEITLSGEQEALFQIMEKTSNHLFVTGRAGTGKSVLLRHFRENTSKKVIIAAPTGIAALNVKGQTLHSLFKIKPELHTGRLAANEKVCTLIKRIDTLVIDEISMVRADLLDAVNERFQEACDNKLPFGGKQVIMFGDVYQLPPVVDRDLVDYFEAVHGGYFFFNAHVWTKSIFEGFKIYELSQVFRQKDPIFRNILNDVRDGSFVQSQLDTLNARYGAPVPLEGTVTLAPTNNLVTTINQQKLDQLPGKLYKYNAIITGEMKRGTFPTEEILQLKKGAQVVMLKNDMKGRWVNGTVGNIEELSDKSITVRVKDIEYTLEPETWEEIAYTYEHDTQKVESKVVSSFTQYPIRLAWAMTIHKSQGQTYESVALDLSTPTFAPGQMYVALSRCTSLEGLYLKRMIKGSFIMVDAKVVEFMARRETIKVEVVEETNVVESTLETSGEAQETALAIAEQPASTKNKAGRKAYDASDKKLTTAYVVDPSINEALKLFSASLDSSQSDVLTAALLEYAPFKAFFEASTQHAEYTERQERIAANKVVKKAKKVKKVETPQSELDPTPDDDKPSGAPNAPQPDQASMPQIATPAPLVDQELESELASIGEVVSTHLASWTNELELYSMEAKQPINRRVNDLPIREQWR